jgi:hypothetical protein
VGAVEDERLTIKGLITGTVLTIKNSGPGIHSTLKNILSAN